MKHTLKTNALVLAAMATTLAVNARAEGIGFYALLDGGLAQTSISGGAASINGKAEFISGGRVPNFFGIKGDRDLGEGYTGGFALEQGFLLQSPNNPNGPAGPFAANSQFSFGDKDGLFNRLANLYLTGAAGTFRIGIQPNQAFSTVVAFDPRGASHFGSALPAVVTAGGLTTDDFGSLSYTTPAYSGLTGSLQYKPQNSDAYSGTRLTVNYAGEGLTAGISGYTNSSSANGDSNGFVLGMGKQLGDFNLKLVVADQTTATYKDLLTVGLGGAYQATAKTSLDAGFYTSKKDSYDVNTAAVGAQYKLLKDLTFYAQYASVKNGGTATAVFNFTPPNDTNFQGTIGTGQTAQTISLGFIYAFF